MKWRHLSWPRILALWLRDRSLPGRPKPVSFTIHLATTDEAKATPSDLP